MFALSVLQKVALPKPDSFRRSENKKEKMTKWKSLEEQEVHNLYSCPKIVVLINKQLIM